MIWEAVNEGGDCTNIGGPWSGFSTRASGQQGGEPTPINKAHILRGNEKIDIMHPHIPVDLKTGDHLVTMTSGGAGVGVPEERDPEAVGMDVKNELVSTEMARNVYKVILEPDTLEIDHEATKKLRGKS